MDFNMSELQLTLEALGDFSEGDVSAYTLKGKIASGTASLVAGDILWITLSVDPGTGTAEEKKYIKVLDTTMELTTTEATIGTIVFAGASTATATGTQYYCKKA